MTMAATKLTLELSVVDEFRRGLSMREIADARSLLVSDVKRMVRDALQKRIANDRRRGRP